ncbi:hypothetical protein BRADI_2g01698v3 [Brachypodium distachyon]|uniref:RING-type E3 ubiquitin transferase n=1 Tax=Brachypodium distachyon TaxID=15368 RepID=A0A0Q3JVH6_BRADI|nr:hypothetical protein BRADI_2g01698v3 [Brachypodium distachyon]
MKNEAECSAAKKTEVALAAAAPAGFTFTMDDHDILECPICSHPLRPPVFKCTVGHLICSSCHDKLLDKDMCHFCCLSTVYKRCYTAERLVQSIKVACSNGNHGCAAKIKYYQKEDHEKTCPHAPCFCPETGCGFSGTTVALLDHLCGQHKWHSSNLKVQPMLLDLRGAIIISVCCIQPHDAGSKFKCTLNMETCFVGQYVMKAFYTRSTNLHDGLPTDCDKFRVPSNLLRGGTTMLGVTLIRPE